MRRSWALAALTFLAGAAAAQETAYVTDQLQLGLHRAEDTSDEAFATLTSGTELTVLERASNFSRVRTADGQEGWVRSFYLVSEAPASYRLAEAEAEVERLTTALEEATAENDEASTAAASLVAEAERELVAAEASRETLERLERENDAYAERVALYRGSIPWPWVAGALILVLVGGFLGGWWWLDASIRRRYGGFRMY